VSSNDHDPGVENPVRSAATDDDDFTDLEIAEQDTDRTADLAANGELEQAQARAAQLRVHAQQLGQLDDAELSEHVEYYQRAHSELQRALSDIDHA
jgi:hypothetical protein